MFSASYLLSSTGIRYNQEWRPQNLWLPKIKPSKGLSPKVIRERADKVFQLMPDRMKHLVIVNGNLCEFEMIQASVEIAEKYAENIMVIPSILARMTYALEDIAKFQNPPKDEIILIVTVTQAFVDFVILRRNQNDELNITHRFMYKGPNSCMKEFPRIYEKYFPHATVVLAHVDLLHFADEIKHSFKPENFFVSRYKRWDHLLMHGALLRAPEGIENFDTRYHIPNFATGIETVIPGKKGRCVILEDRTQIPCDLYGLKGKPQPVTLFYFPEHLQYFDDLIFERKDASTKCIWLNGSPDQVIGYYDARGVPYITATKNGKENIEKNNVKKEPNQTLALSNEQQDQTLSSTPTKSVRFLESATFPKITFVFEEQFSAVEIFENGFKRMAKDSNGNEWIPLYLSMASGKPEIGQKAKNDYLKFPKFVIYDIFKVVGKPLNEIEVDPKWGFELIEDDGNIYFQIETPSGPRRIPQQTVISAFLKTMKLLAEADLGNQNQIQSFDFSSKFGLTKSQKFLFEKAAEKSNLKIMSFVVTDSQ